MSHKEPELREQDRWLPIANVARLMKNTLPASAKVSKDAKECMQECVSEFISFITSEASDNCLGEKRKTINGEDILLAMLALGFENYSEALKIYLTKYRQQQALKQERGETRKRQPSSSSGAASSHLHLESFDQNDNDLDLDNDNDNESDLIMGDADQQLQHHQQHQLHQHQQINDEQPLDQENNMPEDHVHIHGPPSSSNAPNANANAAAAAVVAQFDADQFSSADQFEANMDLIKADPHLLESFNNKIKQNDSLANSNPNLNSNGHNGGGFNPNNDPNNLGPTSNDNGSSNRIPQDNNEPMSIHSQDKQTLNGNGNANSGNNLGGENMDVDVNVNGEGSNQQQVPNLQSVEELMNSHIGKNDVHQVGNNDDGGADGSGAGNFW